LLAATGGIGAAAFLAACGGSKESDSSAGAVATQAPGAAVNASANAPQAKMGGVLKMGIAAEPQLLDPHYGYGGNEHAFLYPIFDQLIAYDNKGQLTPELSLAQAWEVTDPQRIVLKLRQGVKFSDGPEFTAEDVKWNLERITDPKGTATPKADLASLESVQVVSKYEAVLKLKEPSAPFLINLGDRGGMMVSPAAFNKIGKDDFARRPVGSGPFVLKEWLSDASLTYERNPLYWRKNAAGQQMPYLQTIRMSIIPETQVQVASLESGEIDLLPGTPAQDVKRLNADARFQSAKFVGASTRHWSINHASAPFDNVWFRKAFASALERKQFIQNFETGEEPLANGLLTPASWGHDPSIQNYDYDPAKVREYLQRSGLPQAQWKVKAIPQGTTMSEAEQYWDEQARQAGLPIDWLPAERNGRTVRLLVGFGGDGKANNGPVGWSLRVDPDGNVGQYYTQEGKYNPGLAPTPETEALVVRARQIYDQAERKKLYSEIQKKAIDQVYSHTLLYYSVSRAHATKKVGNLEAYYGGEGKPRYGNLWIG